MISFEYFEMENGIPIYLQILLYIKRGIVAGIIKDNDELPSRRVLSALLGVNPNTVQKAYRMLEEEGYIQSRSGAKSYMVLSEEKIEATRRQLIEEEARSLVERFHMMGLEKEEVLSLVEKYWEA
ncbi:MAG: GntR family transcriptional regulator [Lachnospiraceae bacterium]|nr:GntR family transcriptional regulator [Lachnospiraceae bacterium]